MPAPPASPRLRSSIPLLAALFLLAPAVAQAARGAAAPAPEERIEPGVVRHEVVPEALLRQGSRVRGLHRTQPPVQEVYVFQDSLEGRPLDDDGGWTHYDNSERPTAWNIGNTLNCQQGNAFWCGVVDSSWIYDSNRAGYDNDWVHYLQNSTRIDSIPANSTIRISFRHRFSAEPDYDYGLLEVLDPVESWTPIATFTGEVSASQGKCDTFTVVVPDTIKNALLNDPEGIWPLFFRFTFTSDLQSSSADGLYNGDGWLIDNVTVRAGNNRILFFDNFENGMGTWERSVYPGVGDYWDKAASVSTEDRCVDNRSNIWVDWDPLVLSLVPRLDNWLLTPPVATLRASEVFTAFDVFRSLPLDNCFYYHLRFRTRNVGDANWSSWADPTRLLYYGGQKDWVRQRVTLAGAGNKDSVQVKIGLKDFGATYCGGTSSGSGTYAHFDNVAIGIVTTAPPRFVPRDLDVFQDAFFTTPYMGRDDNFNTPLGDSVVVQVNVSRGYKQGFMHYRLNGGSFASVPLARSSAALPSVFYADVPAGSYPANTTVEYYFAVTDSQNTTGYYPVDAPETQTYLSASVLPVKRATNPALGCTDSLSTILFVNNNAGREPAPYIASALKSWGFRFDTWDVNGPSSGVGNTPGGTDPADPMFHWPPSDVNSLLLYSTIVWHSGSMNAFSISPQDQAMLQSWVQQPGKSRNLWLTGDNIAYELAFRGKEYNSFLPFTCGMRYIRNVWEDLPQDSLRPIVTGLAGTPSAGRYFHANADCPQIDQFDMIQNSSGAFTTGKAGPFLNYPNSFPAATRYARKYTTFGTDSARVVFQGFSFNDIEEGGERLQLAKVIVQDYFLENPCYYPSGVEADPPSPEGAPRFRDALEQNAPNPFNPQTVIGYSVSQPGRVEIRVFSAGGALVRRFVEHPGAAGRYAVRWNGTDDSGRRLGSGVYFYEIETQGGYRAARKLLLLK
jgi:hypothetical protein